MKTGARLESLTVEQAQARLEAAASKLVRNALWHSPYNVVPSCRAKVNELRKPLIELRLARKKEGAS